MALTLTRLSTVPGENNESFIRLRDSLTDEEVFDKGVTAFGYTKQSIRYSIAGHGSASIEVLLNDVVVTSNASPSDPWEFGVRLRRGTNKIRVRRTDTEEGSNEDFIDAYNIHLFLAAYAAEFLNLEVLAREQQQGRFLTDAVIQEPVTGSTRSYETSEKDLELHFSDTYRAQRPSGYTRENWLNFTQKLVESTTDSPLQQAMNLVSEALTTQQPQIIPKRTYPAIQVGEERSLFTAFFRDNFQGETSGTTDIVLENHIPKWGEELGSRSGVVWEKLGTSDLVVNNDGSEPEPRLVWDADTSFADDTPVEGHVTSPTGSSDGILRATMRPYSAGGVSARMLSPLMRVNDDLTEGWGIGFLTSSDRITLVKLNGSGTPFAVATASYSWDPLDPQEVELRASGSQFTIAVGGVDVISYFDADDYSNNTRLGVCFVRQSGVGSTAEKLAAIESFQFIPPAVDWVTQPIFMDRRRRLDRGILNLDTTGATYVYVDGELDPVDALQIKSSTSEPTWGNNTHTETITDIRTDDADGTMTGIENGLYVIPSFPITSGETLSVTNVGTVDISNVAEYKDSSGVVSLGVDSGSGTVTSVVLNYSRVYEPYVLGKVQTSGAPLSVYDISGSARPNTSWDENNGGGATQSEREYQFEFDMLMGGTSGIATPIKAQILEIMGFLKPSGSVGNLYFEGANTEIPWRPHKDGWVFYGQF